MDGDQSSQNQMQNQPMQTMQNKSADGMAVTSLVTGILSMVFFWFWPLSLLFAILGFVFGGVSYAKNKSGMALAGLICSGAGVVFMVLFIVFAIVVFKDAVAPNYYY